MNTLIVTALLLLTQDPDFIPKPAPQCQGIDPATSAVEVMVEGEPRLALTPLAASCLFADAEALEATLRLREEHWRKIMSVRDETAVRLQEAHEREIARTHDAYEKALDAAEGSATFWKWTVGAALVAGVGAGAVAGYYLTR